MSQQLSSCHLNQKFDRNHTLACSWSTFHDNHLFSTCSLIFIISPENVLISHFLLINHLEFRISLRHLDDAIYQTLGRNLLAIFYYIDRLILITFPNISCNKFAQFIFFILAEYGSFFCVFPIAFIRYTAGIHIVMHKHAWVQTYLSQMNGFIEIIEKGSITCYLVTRMGGFLQSVFITCHNKSIFLRCLHMLPLFQLYHNDIGHTFTIQARYDKVYTVIGNRNIIFQCYTCIIGNRLTIYHSCHISQRVMPRADFTFARFLTQFCPHTGCQYIFNMGYIVQESPFGVVIDNHGRPSEV